MYIYRSPNVYTSFLQKRPMINGSPNVYTSFLQKRPMINGSPNGLRMRLEDVYLQVHFCKRAL